MQQKLIKSALQGLAFEDSWLRVADQKSLLQHVVLGCNMCNKKPVDESKADKNDKDE